jgi:hypothetical protein
MRRDGSYGSGDGLGFRMVGVDDGFRGSGRGGSNIPRVFELFS